MQIKKIACVQLENSLPDFSHLSIMPHYGLPVIGVDYASNFIVESLE